MLHSTVRPITLVVFGITGDLATKKILPALYDLEVQKKLPLDFRIVGFSRRPFSENEIRDFARSTLLHDKREAQKKAFCERITYVQGNFDVRESYLTLAEHLYTLDTPRGGCSDKLFYLSVPPTLYESLATEIHTSGLSIPCGGEDGWSRVLIEKPFGNDTHTAEALDALLGELFKEEQIFRIDHYLAKSTLFNILEERKSNPEFEATLNTEHVEKIEINLFETARVGDRGAFYDAIGAFRDVGQNHMLQMLALIAMDTTNLDTSHPRDVQKARARILSHLIPYTEVDLQKTVRGQYEGYLEEKGVAPDSTTETFFSLPVYLNTERFRGVPFILSSGKALSKNATEINIYFKDGTTKTYAVPGSDSLPAYQKILLDCISGDQTVFTSTEEVIAEWKFVTPIVEMWKSLSKPVLYTTGASQEAIHNLDEDFKKKYQNFDIIQR